MAPSMPTIAPTIGATNSSKIMPTIAANNMKGANYKPSGYSKNNSMHHDVKNSSIPECINDDRKKEHKVDSYDLSSTFSSAPF